MRELSDIAKRICHSLALSGRSAGATMLWAIASLVGVGALAAAMASMNPTALQDKLAGERASAAYFASLSGLGYVKNMAEMAASGTFGEGWAMSSLNGTYALENGTKFVLSVTGSSSPYQVASRGVVQTGSANEANYQAVASVSYTPYVAPVPETEPNLGDYNFLNPSNRVDYAVYSTSQTRDIPTSFDNADITTKNLTVGKDYTYGFGNIWYTGTNTGLSSNGVSTFGTGFRVFFTFKFSTNVGDGFVFAVLNALQNNYLSSGGDSAEGGLLGYAGDSRVYDSSGGGFSSTVLEYVDSSGLTKGLNPPKFGIEIDTYTNDSDKWYPDSTAVSCNDDNGFMNDSTSDGIGHHVGIMYWGTDAAYLRKTCYGPGSSFLGNLKRYSDVRHGSGSNAGNSSGNKLKYMNFVAGRTYFFRMDVVKSGKNMTIKSWIGTCSDDDLNSTCTKQVYGSSGTSTSHTGTLSDTQNDFAGATSSLNKLKRIYVYDTYALTTAENTKFTNFMWGFTSGSGVETQQIDFRNISLSFR